MSLGARSFDGNTRRDRHLQKYFTHCKPKFGALRIGRGPLFSSSGAESQDQLAVG